MACTCAVYIRCVRHKMQWCTMQISQGQKLKIVLLELSDGEATRSIKVSRLHAQFHSDHKHEILV